MGQTLGQLKTTVRTNLEDTGVGTFYSDDDLNAAVQDAYDDIVCMTQCIAKSVDVPWQANLSYYDFVALGITDYLAPVALFNYNTNRWLRDDLNLRDFDRLRRDWELWSGTPQFWASSDPHHIAIAPKYSEATGGAFEPFSFSDAFFTGNHADFGKFKLVYWAQAPALVDDSSLFLIATDMQNLLEFYTTADLLEQFEEFSKAGEYFEKYYNGLPQYADRVKRINKSDLVLRV